MQLCLRDFEIEDGQNGLQNIRPSFAE